MESLVEELVTAVPRRVIGQIRALADEQRLEVLRLLIVEASRLDKADSLAARARARADETWRRAHETLDQASRLGTERRLMDDWEAVLKMVRAARHAPLWRARTQAHKFGLLLQ